MRFKFGLIDLTQSSTWRGIFGFAAAVGMYKNPEFTDQIAIALGAVLSAIEVIRNERKTIVQLPPIELQSVAAASAVAPQQLRDLPLPSESNPESDNPNAGFNG